jgi:ABC-type sugar transport system ATPase subunit
LYQRQSRAVIQHKTEHIAALVQLQDLLLCDEPLRNLDAELRLHMRAESKRLQRSLGMTAVLVTHDQTEALSMADRSLITPALSW